jgi:hypothetical protein
VNKEYKAKAIALRKAGKTYREIRKEIPVAKSTLSDWFRSVELSVPQRQRVTQVRIDAALRGAHARRDKRLAEIQTLTKKGVQEVGKISERELWLIGTALHWAEGSKQRESAKSAGVIFTNGDPQMLSFFLKWLDSLGVQRSDIRFELYVHENRSKEIPEFKLWWSKKLVVPVVDLSTVYFKRDKINTKRQNVADLYHGILRIKVRSSTFLNRQVNGWIEGIASQ